VRHQRKGRARATVGSRSKQFTIARGVHGKKKRRPKRVNNKRGKTMTNQTETVLGQLKLNVLTREMYEALSASNELSETELYIIQEAVNHNALSNRNTGFQHTASTIVFDDFVSLQEKLNHNTLIGMAQNLGASTTTAISQNAVSEEFAKIYAALTSLGWQP